MVGDTTAQQVASATDDNLFLCRQVAGTLAVEQHGREVHLEGGDIALIDPLVPCTAKYASGSKLLVLTVPRSAVQARIGNTRDFVARAVKPWGEGGIMSSYLMTLPIHADRLGPTSTATILGQVFDLMAVALARTMEAKTPRLSSAASLALLKLRAVIESRLSDSTLDDDAVAAAAGISVRYANSLLAAEGMSIMRLVQARRLERCRKALEDPMQAQRTLSEIAFSWGFSDMTHFGRRFKAAYGAVPSEHRAKALSRAGSSVQTTTR
ncbi:MAG TPA: helix-turn-helix domain-containing protein [Dongiaceae bacterium]|nr:helix-turn-helix domain-containing protein [Dongiaceae bacterium]